MATPSKSAGTLHSSGSEAQPGKIATLPGGFRASESLIRARMQLINDIERRLAQLDALMNSIHGGGFESFSSLDARVQDDILWLANDLASSIRADFENLTRGDHQEAKNA